MRLSNSITKTSKTATGESDSVNYQLLTRAGFIEQSSSGVYSYLPLGTRVLDKVSSLVRKQMTSTGAEEIIMPILHAKHYWQTTGRWDEFDVMYKLTSSQDSEFALGPSHEEIVTPLAKHFIRSYADLPRAVYQIQTKFRDEPRAKSGLLRGREFLMKDLYSFHQSASDLDRYYAEVISAYRAIYAACGLDARLTAASGGVFSKYSDEFQVIAEAGEDTIYYCDKCEFSQNDEIATVRAGDKCPDCGGKIEQASSIEVGNIFKLGDRYSRPVEFSLADKDGQHFYPLMGCYGLGISRLVGTIVELHHDERGIIWPAAIAPADVHLICIGSDQTLRRQAEAIYAQLSDQGTSVIYDDRDVPAGVKFADADLIGVPWRLSVSAKTAAAKSVELKARDKADLELVELSQIAAQIAQKLAKP